MEDVTPDTIDAGSSCVCMCMSACVWVSVCACVHACKWVSVSAWKNKSIIQTRQEKGYSYVVLRMKWNVLFVIEQFINVFFTIDNCYIYIYILFLFIFTFIMQW